MTKNLRSIAAIIFFTLTSLTAYSQWTQRQGLNGLSRTFATGFTVDNTIYVMGGFDGSTIYSDVWAYDATSDTWTQKGDFPGGTRAASTAFTIGNKAYMGTGVNGNNYLKDFWEYDPSSDTWTQKADFPGYEREEAVGFCIGNKGYIGTGQTFVISPNTSFTTTYNDLYEYDPATDSWTEKDSIPFLPRAYAVAAVVGNKAYVGLGGNNDQTESYYDFYEYDPVADTWTPKPPMGGSGRADAGIVANGNNIFVFGGINFPTFGGYSSCRMYDAVTDTWTNAAGFSAGIIIAPVVQNLNGRVFAGTGFYNGQIPRNDWWEFTSLPTSIETLEKEQSLVFPNPFTDELKLNINVTSAISSTGGISVISVISGNGKLVYSTQQKITGSGTITIDTKNFSTGIYFLRITNSSGEVIASKKIIKS